MKLTTAAGSHQLAQGRNLQGHFSVLLHEISGVILHFPEERGAEASDASLQGAARGGGAAPTEHAGRCHNGGE